MRSIVPFVVIAMLLAGCADDKRVPGPVPTPAGLSLLGSVATHRSDGQRGFNGDVWVHAGHAYVGTWGKTDKCPGSSVKIVDLTNPTAPRQIRSIAEHPGTTSEDIVVRSVSTPFFAGDLLAVGLQSCADSGLAGVELWDVTDPANPRHLSTSLIGPFVKHGVKSPDEAHDHDLAEVRGVHELDLEARGGEVFLYLAVPGGEGSSHEAGMLIMDATDPTSPDLIAGFGAPEDLGHTIVPGEFVHSVRVDPATRTAYASYWDFGVVALDVNDPARPRYLGRTVFPAGAEGNAHSVAFAKGSSLLLQCDEDFSPAARDGIEPGSGFLRIFYNSSPAAFRAGTFRTPNSRLAAPPAGFFSIHNVEVVGNRVYAAWYSDGVRVIDIATATSPREVDAWVPPATPDPFVKFAMAPIVWGVAVSGDLVVLSDINAGLYVLRRDAFAHADSPDYGCTVAVVISARNEELTIREAVVGAKAYAETVVVMDGHSTDRTADEARAAGAIVHLDPGLGKGSAIRRSLELVDAEIVVLMDADGSHDPADIPKLVTPVARGEAALCVGSRFAGGSEELSVTLGQLIRTIGNISMNLAINWRFGVSLSDTLNGYRAGRRAVLQRIGLKENIHTIEQEMVMKTLRHGERVLNVPTHEYARRHGDSHINIWRVWPKFVWCVAKNIGQRQATRKS